VGKLTDPGDPKHVSPNGTIAAGAAPGRAQAGSGCMAYERAWLEEVHQAVATTGVVQSDTEAYQVMCRSLSALGLSAFVVSLLPDAPSTASEGREAQCVVVAASLPRPRLLRGLERRLGYRLAGHRMPVADLPLHLGTFHLTDAVLTEMGTDGLALLLPGSDRGFANRLACRVGNRSCVTVPLPVYDHSAAALLLVGDNLQSDHVPFLQSLARHASIGLEYSSLIATERRRRAEAEMLSELAIAVNSTLGLDEVLEMAVHRLQKLHQATACSVSFLDEDGKTFFLKATTDPALDVTTERVTFPASRSIAGRALRERRVQISNDLSQARQHYAPLAQRTPAGSVARSMLTAPLYAGEAPLGVIQVLSESPGAFGEGDAQLLTTTAGLISSAVARARTYDQVVELADELSVSVEARTAEVDRERERLLAVLENAGGGIAIAGPDGTLEYANPAWERLTGYDVAYAVQQKMRIVTPETFPDLFGSLHSLAFRPRVYSRELADSRPDGSSYVVDVTVSPVFVGSGDARELVSLVAMYRDVTEMKELDRIKGVFLDAAAHQLRTPLTSILGFSELLLSRTDLPQAKRGQFLRHINERARQLSVLVQDLLDISQFESGAGFELHLEPFDLCAVLQDELASWQTRNARHRYVLSDASARPLVYADKERIVRQVVGNLLSNATKYSPAGGTITATVAAGGRYVEVTVADEGLGMTREQMASLFTKFWRADGSATASEGAGLGLVMVRYVVEQHGGRVWVESTPKRGTAIHFTLLQAEHPTTVLLVDDEDTVLEFEEHILRVAGIKTVLATSGQEALKMAAVSGPDLVVLDLMMPGMSGLDVMAALKTDPATAPIPVLVASALSSWQVIEEAHRAGAVDFLTKPFSPEELVSRVRRVLSAEALPVSDRKPRYGVVVRHGAGMPE
jgi:PAS domain S-box-containing protein